MKVPKSLWKAALPLGAFHQNEMLLALPELIITHFKKSRKSGNFCKLLIFDSNKVSENYTVKGDKIRNDEVLCRNKPIIREILYNTRLHLPTVSERKLVAESVYSHWTLAAGRKRPKHATPEMSTNYTLQSVFFRGSHGSQDHTPGVQLRTLVSS